MSELLKRSEISYADLKHLDEEAVEEKEVIEQIDIHFKYNGYFQRMHDEIMKMKELEKEKIPSDIEYDKINNIAYEAKEKLKKIKPETFGQLLRIPGINPADAINLRIYLKQKDKIR
jgi:tRNA uridine 5-carboxymethylaminomethyl modification enzyme